MKGADFVQSWHSSHELHVGPSMPSYSSCLVSAITYKDHNQALTRISRAQREHKFSNAFLALQFGLIDGEGNEILQDPEAEGNENPEHPEGEGNTPEGDDEDGGDDATG